MIHQSAWVWAGFETNTRCIFQLGRMYGLLMLMVAIEHESA